MAAFQSNMSFQDIALTVKFFTDISSNWSLKFLHLQDEEVVTWPELHFGLFDLSLIYCPVALYHKPCHWLNVSAGGFV